MKTLITKVLSFVLAWVGRKLSTKRKIAGAATLALLGLAGIISAVFPDLGLPAVSLEQAIDYLTQAFTMVTSDGAAE